MYEALVHWTCSWTLLLAGLKNLGHTGYGDVKHVGTGVRDASSVIYTMITKRKCAPRHTSTRCVQYLQDRGLLCDTPPCDLHSICNAEVCFGTHLRAICIVIANVFKRPIYFGGALCDTPPRDLHSFYKCFCASGMFSFNFGGALFAHLRAICTVFTTTYAFRRCARLGIL